MSYPAYSPYSQAPQEHYNQPYSINPNKNSQYIQHTEGNPYQQSGFQQNPYSSQYQNEYRQPNQISDTIYSQINVAKPQSQEQDFNQLLQGIQQNNREGYEQAQVRNAQMAEMEMIIEAERRKAMELREKMDGDLNNERKNRVELENKLIKLKDEAMKREVYVQEILYKVNTGEQENEQLQNEVKNYKSEILRLQDIYGLKIRELEEKVVGQNKQLFDNEEKHRQFTERMKQDFENNMDSCNKQWEFRFKSLEEKFKQLNMQKNDIDQENRRLNEGIIKIKMQAEEQQREISVRIQEEEFRKFQSHARKLEQQLKSSDEAREAMTRKNKTLLKELQDKDHALNDQYMAFENELSKYKQEISENMNQMQQNEIQRDRFKNEMQKKDQDLNRFESQLIDQSQQFQKIRDESQRQIDDINKQNLQERRLLEDQRDTQAKKILEQTQIIKQMESEINRLKTEYQNLTQSLQSNINKTIFQVVNENSNVRVPEVQQQPYYGYKY